MHHTLLEAANHIISQIDNELSIKFDRATITRLHVREYLQGIEIPFGEYVRSVLVSHTRDSHEKNITSTDPRFHRPIKDDLLIQGILQKGSNQIVIYPDIQINPPDGWEVAISEDIKSWILVSLWDEEKNKPIALLTLDFIGEKIKETNIDGYKNALVKLSREFAVLLKETATNELRQKLHQALDTLAKQNKENARDTLDAVAKQTCELVNGLFAYVVRPETLQEQLARDTNTHKVKLKFLSAEPIEALEKLHDDAHLFLTESDETNQDRGITVKAFMDGREYVIDDCQRVFGDMLKGHRDWYFRFDYIEGKSTGSNLAVPIIAKVKSAINAFNDTELVEEYCLGVINVEHESPCRFSEEEIEAVKEFADHAAIALKTLIDKDYLNNLYELSNTTQTITKLVRSRLGNEEDLLENIMNDFADKTRIVSDASSGVRIFLNYDNTFRLIGASKDIRKKSENVLPRGTKGHSWWCIENRYPVIINDTERYRKIIEDVIEGDIRYKNSDNVSIKVNENTRDTCVVGLPMCHREDTSPLGVIWLHYKRKKMISVEEIKVLQTFANGLAVLLFNIREYRLLRFAERIAGYQQTYEVRNELADDICKYISIRFNVDGAVYYAFDKFESNLKRIGTNYVIDKFGRESPYRKLNNSLPVEIERGLVGRLFVEINDSMIYEKNIQEEETYLKYFYDGEMIYVPYYPYYAQVLRDKKVYITADDSILNHPFRSVLAVIMKAGGTNEKVGVLLISQEDNQVVREFGEDTREEFKRIAQLTSSLIVSAEFFKPSLSLSQLLMILIYAVLFGVLALLPELITDNQIDIRIRIVIAVLVVTGTGYSLYPEIRKRISHRYS